MLKKSSRKRTSNQRYRFKSGNWNFAKETAAISQWFVKDPEKLKEEEIALLPLKDFWDSKKKEWKKNIFGTFVKCNSEKMKTIFGNQAFESS